ncbi:family 16 glycosylhydrolase [Botrimarina hoheduenensis]|uniref:family 16 glycosylhydrolase n=1 Tax=Botrimarina hoheduenensis TaxID=2528000 RepID=UPI0018D3AA95|nr:family 16 glycosylhydrolase [Botrimarina hoheduenensis]
MHRPLLLLTAAAVLPTPVTAAEWDRYAVPADPGPTRVWRLEERVSDEFRTEFGPTNRLTEIGGKWKNHYIGRWDGPGTTVWRHENVSIDQSKLKIIATRVPGETQSFKNADSTGGPPKEYTLPATRLGCISSLETIEAPVYLEARVKIPNAVLAANVWMLSGDSTQEIDVLESYGGAGDDGRNDWFAQRIHFSHHTFIRAPFQDYQPHDASTWYTRPGLKAGPGGGYWTKQFHRFGVYWRDPTHLEYYLDGELVKVTSGLDDADGIGGIDPPGFTRNEEGVRTGLNKPLHVIINMEAQTWNAVAGRHPTDAEIRSKRDHTYLVDWVRAYKPIEESDTKQ